MANERMLDGEIVPTERGMRARAGRRARLWCALREYLADHYDHPAELGFDGGKYGWAIRYRKSGKTLITLYPEHGSFSALIVLGKKEVASIDASSTKLSKRVQVVYEDSAQRHDGRWLWIRPSSKADVESIKVLLAAKRRPK